jgi:hypothetical protein
MLFICGFVKRGGANSRVLYLDNGVMMSATVPRSFVPHRAFTRGVERAARHATQRDLGHELVRVTLGRVIRSCPQNSRCQAMWGWGQGTALIDTANAIHGRVVEIERRNLRP